MTGAPVRLLIATDAVGGIWQYSVDLARGLAPLGVETMIALLGPPPTDAQRSAASTDGVQLIETGLPLDWLAEESGTIHRAGEVVARLAKQCSADIVQLNIPALAASARFDQPVVAVQHRCVATWWEAVHGTELPADFAWRMELVRAGLHSADLVVTPTIAFGQEVERVYALPQSPVTVHTGRSRLVLPRGVPHDFVFTAGRLWDEGKDLRTLDAAASRIGVPVHAAGPLEGPNGSQVMFDNLHSLGNLEEDQIARWLCARPVFVSTALYEPVGLAVLEAAAAGCALILSDIPTFRELWSDVAIFVPPRDDKGFTRTISDLVGDDFERAVLGRAARERASLRTPEAMAAQMAFHYRTLLPVVRKPLLAAMAAA